MSKSLVLFSGGADSATALVREISAGNKVIALNMYYSQRNAVEIMQAKRLCTHYGVTMREVDLTEIFRPSNPLTNTTMWMPQNSYRVKEIPATYVPFRNGVFAAIAAAEAYELGCDKVVLGVHGENYPDTSGEFIEYMCQAVYTGTGGRCQLVAPFAYASKADIISTGLQIGVPYELTWSCYDPQYVEEGRQYPVRPCGKCATCQERADAFAANNIADPLKEVYRT